MESLRRSSSALRQANQAWRWLHGMSRTAGGVVKIMDDGRRSTAQSADVAVVHARREGGGILELAHAIYRDGRRCVETRAVSTRFQQDCVSAADEIKEARCKRLAGSCWSHYPLYTTVRRRGEVTGEMVMKTVRDASLTRVLRNVSNQQPYSSNGRVHCETFISLGLIAFSCPGNLCAR